MALRSVCFEVSSTWFIWSVVWGWGGRIQWHNSVRAPNERQSIWSLGTVREKSICPSGVLTLVLAPWWRGRRVCLPGLLAVGLGASWGCYSCPEVWLCGSKSELGLSWLVLSNQGGIRPLLAGPSQVGPLVPASIVRLHIYRLLFGSFSFRWFIILCLSPLFWKKYW